MGHRSHVHQPRTFPRLPWDADRRRRRCADNTEWCNSGSTSSSCSSRSSAASSSTVIVLGRWWPSGETIHVKIGSIVDECLAGSSSRFFVTETESTVGEVDVKEERNDRRPREKRLFEYWINSFDGSTMSSGRGTTFR